ncbi:MAG: YaiI/YqxD family protein [Nitrospiraceae bacterium]|nr:YaiI/YqxD family protein [Nitrospiraceae bacterium]
MQILVDADALPGAIRLVLFRAAERVRVPLVLVANQSLRVPESAYISSLAAPSGPDGADDRITELVEPGDLVVTADIPLADRVVEKGACALDPRGQLHTEETIKHRLAMRDLMDQLRTDGAITGGPPAFNRKDVQAFANQLDRFLTRHC